MSFSFYKKFCFILLLTSCQVRCSGNIEKQEPQINYCVISESYMTNCEKHSEHAQWGDNSSSYYWCCKDKPTYEQYLKQ